MPAASITSPISSPISCSAAEIAATCAICSRVVTLVEFLSSASPMARAPASTPRFSAIGSAPAATFFMPSWMIAWPSTVAVVVPSPAMSLVLDAISFASWAPIFSNGALSSMSLAMVTPSLVIVGDPNFLSSTTLRPLGPRVIFTASASASMPSRSAWRACSSNSSCFAMVPSSALVSAFVYPIAYPMPFGRCARSDAAFSLRRHTTCPPPPV